jgi:hypothetical protein
MESLEHDNVVRYIGHDFNHSENIRLYVRQHASVLITIVISLFSIYVCVLDGIVSTDVA